MRIPTLLLVAALAAAAPCDIYDSAGTPCVAAHSVIRAMYSAYNGPLYSVRRLSDNATLEIGVVTAGGFANTAKQNAFCGNDCVIQTIFDQSPNKNDLTPAPPGGAVPKPDSPVNATKFPVTVSGNALYAAYFEGGQVRCYHL